MIEVVERGHFDVQMQMWFRLNCSKILWRFGYFDMPLQLYLSTVRLRLILMTSFWEMQARDAKHSRVLYTLLRPVFFLICVSK